MREAGVRTVVDAASLAVVGLVEVVAHIPRIYGEYRKLQAAARQDPPDLAILTDSPDFHLRLARSEEHTSELQSRQYLVCRLLLEKKKEKCRAHDVRSRRAQQRIQTLSRP